LANNLLPSKKPTLGRSIQINLKKVEGNKTSSSINNTRKVEPSPKNIPKSNHKKDSNIDTRFDRFVYSRKKCPRTNQESELDKFLDQVDVKKPDPKKNLPTSPRLVSSQHKKVVQNPKKQPELFSPATKNKTNRNLEDSGKLFSESSTITGSFLTPKSGNPSEDINESLKKLVGNSKLSTIKPIKVQKIEVIEKKDAYAKHKVVKTKIDSVKITHQIKGHDNDDDQKGIFGNAHMITDVSFSDLNQTGESEGGRLSEMIEGLIQRKDSLF